MYSVIQSSRLQSEVIQSRKSFIIPPAVYMNWTWFLFQWMSIRRVTKVWQVIKCTQTLIVQTIHTTLYYPIQWVQHSHQDPFTFLKFLKFCSSWIISYTRSRIVVLKLSGNLRPTVSACRGAEKAVRRAPELHCFRGVLGLPSTHWVCSSLLGCLYL